MTHEEFSFILPRLDNDGAPVDQAHKKAQAFMLGAWGGYTEQDVKGVWQSATGQIYRDNNVLYTVAIPTRAVEYDRFITLVRELLYLARQEALYVKTPQGVQFITE